MREISKRFLKAPAAVLVGAALVSACGGGGDGGSQCGAPVTTTSSFVYVANNAGGFQGCIYQNDEDTIVAFRGMSTTGE